MDNNSQPTSLLFFLSYLDTHLFHGRKKVKANFSLLSPTVWQTVDYSSGTYTDTKVNQIKVTRLHKKPQMCPGALRKRLPVLQH